MKECIGKYELPVVPRSLFAGDGFMNHTGKSKLIRLLEKHMEVKGGDGFFDVRDYDALNNIVMNVAIVDGMAEVQALKLHQVNTWLDFANLFFL